MFIGLNPSTADEIHNDPTVTRCIRFARGWGFSKLHMTNIFAYRSTDPAALKCADDPVGPLNDSALVALSEISEIVVAAWGVHGGLLGRGNYVRDLIPNLYCLGTTRDGYPRHPLYLKKDLEPMKY